jgi:cytoskeletal protein RodZ
MEPAVVIVVGLISLGWWIWFTQAVLDIRNEAAKITAELRKQTNIAQAAVDAEKKERAAAKARNQRPVDGEEDDS